MPAICNVGERVLPTVQALSEVAERRGDRGGEVTVKTPRRRMAKPKKMRREPEGKGGVILC